MSVSFDAEQLEHGFMIPPRLSLRVPLERHGAILLNEKQLSETLAKHDGIVSYSSVIYGNTIVPRGDFPDIDDMIDNSEVEKSK